MKIIYITNSRIPTEKAHGYQIVKMCEEFAGRGALVELWLPSRTNEITEDIRSFYGLKNNFTIRIIKGFDFYRLFKLLGKLSFWLQGVGFESRLLFIKPDKSALIYAREPEIAWLFNLRGYRTVFEAHSWPEKKAWLYKFLIKKIKKIVVITHGLENLFIQAGFLKNNILVASDAVDLNKFDINISKEEARRKLNLPLDKKIILYTGHLYGWKGADVLANAAESLRSDCLTVFVGGMADDVANFKKNHSGLLASGRLIIYPHQRHEAIPFWLKAADLLVLPNKADRKISSHFTSPLKLFEYMAVKRPIVAADLPSIREILNESNCLFFKAGDPADLAEKILLLPGNEELADKISKQAHSNVKSRSWTKRAEEIIKFISQ